MGNIRYERIISSHSFRWQFWQIQGKQFLNTSGPAHRLAKADSSTYLRRRLLLTCVATVELDGGLPSLSLHFRRGINHCNSFLSISSTMHRHSNVPSKAKAMYSVHRTPTVEPKNILIPKKEQAMPKRDSVNRSTTPEID